MIPSYSKAIRWDEVKCHILKKAKSFILLTFLNISFFLNSARTFFFLALSFFLSFFQSSGRVLWQYENLICVCEVSLFLLLFPSLITVIGALEIHKLITVKSPEIKGKKRVWRKVRKLERMRNTQCIQNVSLGYLCYSHEVEKTERLRSYQEKISIKKDLM